jgi:hypothetical protein
MEVFEHRSELAGPDGGHEIGHEGLHEGLAVGAG